MRLNTNVPPAEKPQHYLETALARGRKRQSVVKGTRQHKERERFLTISTSLVKALTNLHDRYPSFDNFSEFNKRIFQLEMQLGTIKKALAGINGCITTIKKITTEHIARVKNAEDVAPIRNAYIGRISSIFKRLQPHFDTLNAARSILKDMPTVDDELFTVAIAGFPNVGKSTLLKKITTAKPEIKAYAFTTKGLNVGHFEYKYNQIQCIDTPGTLNRKKMNTIEKRADITLRYLADAIVYVYDPTETYSIEMQQQLFEYTKELDKPIVIYVSKTDLVPDTKLEGLTQPAAVTKELTRLFKEWL